MHRSDRARKLCTALLERHTAKSMQVNDKSNFAAGKFCTLQNE